MSGELTAGVPAQEHAGLAHKGAVNPRAGKARKGELLHRALEHIARLLNDPVTPDLPDDLRDNKQLRAIHDYLYRVRDYLSQYATGDFSAEISERGVITGKLRALQANLRQLLWRVQQTEAGDFTQRLDDAAARFRVLAQQVEAGDLAQRVNFLGEFADAFNSMVVHLDAAFTTMRKKEEELSELNKNLADEIDKHNAALRALERSEAEARYIAEHDFLTGILNRRSFFNLAELELQRNHMLNQCCCLVMLDVDFFKNFNDSYGHIEGDRALRHVAEQGKRCLRKNDILGRYGGEEFVFIFSHATLKQGLFVAERIRASVAEHPVCLESGQKKQITVSMGIVEFSTNMAPVDAVMLIRGINAADDALYRAKESGRNAVCVGHID
jgi:diguanylate cyclase (GGDEF)-like protein